jgi:hypothetical protein
MDIVDRNPARLAVLAIDVRDQLLDFMLQPAIPVNVLAAGHDYLVERDATAGGGIIAQQAREGAQALRDALRVVEAVDADGNANSVELLTNLKSPPGYIRARGALRKLLEIDADGKVLDARLPATVGDDAMVMLTIHFGVG